MEKYYSIAIPKPCHQDWSKMSQREKGKFCSSCSKTVIDFTKMKTNDIQDYIHQNKDNRICGHFKQTQLDSINLHIPSQVLEQQHNFHKVFLYALLFTMGTSLMNCTNNQGNQQKIDSIEVIDTLNNKIDILGGLPQISEIDSISNKTCKTRKIKTEQKKQEDSIILGEIIDVVGLIVPKENLNAPISFDAIEIPPEFQNTKQGLSLIEKKAFFQKEISAHIKENFKVPQGDLGLTGRQKINIQFEIDSSGFVKNIKTRAIHPVFNKEAKRIIRLLPQFIPAKRSGKPISIIYNVPIIFQAEE